jgi:hypothetical protein
MKIKTIHNLLVVLLISNGIGICSAATVKSTENHFYFYDRSLDKMDSLNLIKVSNELKLNLKNNLFAYSFNKERDSLGSFIIISYAASQQSYNSIPIKDLKEAIIKQIKKKLADEGYTDKLQKYKVEIKQNTLIFNANVNKNNTFKNIYSIYVIGKNGIISVYAELTKNDLQFNQNKTIFSEFVESIQFEREYIYIYTPTKSKRSISVPVLLLCSFTISVLAFLTIQFWPKKKIN